MDMGETIVNRNPIGIPRNVGVAEMEDGRDASVFLYFVFCVFYAYCFLFFVLLCFVLFCFEFDYSLLYSLSQKTGSQKCKSINRLFFSFSLCLFFLFSFFSIFLFFFCFSILYSLTLSLFHSF